MYKTIIPFYIICFVLYIFFTRRPDFQDGEFINATIHYTKNSEGKIVPRAIFNTDKKDYSVDAYYPLRGFKEGEKVSVIYEATDPTAAAVYSWWGYWIKWDEMLASIILSVVLLYAAKAITAGPTPEALVEELEMKNPPKRRKYD